MAEVTEVGQAETPQQMEARIYTAAMADAEARFEVWKAKELVDLADKQQETIREEVSKLVKEYQDKQKPLSVEEIQKMVDQEYAELTIKVMVGLEKDGKPELRHFTIRELPQSVEKKFYRQFVDKVKAEGPKLAAFQQRNMDQPFETVMGDFMETFESGFDILASAVALILNPFGEDEEITPDWVSRRISSNRQYSIVQAQVEVNKLRDFFSRVFRDGQNAGTILMPPSSRSSRGRVQ